MSGIANAKQSMRWKAPSERAGCGNCKFAPVARDTFKADPRWCVKGGFLTNPNAICDHWADAIGVRG